MIIRTSKKNRFTVIHNDAIEDKSLDWRDLGLLVYLLSKPDNWEISPAHLIKERKLGRDGVYAALKSLCDAGYASKTPNKTGGWNWVVYDVKQDSKPEGMPLTEFPEAANNPVSGKSVSGFLTQKTRIIGFKRRRYAESGNSVSGIESRIRIFRIRKFRTIVNTEYKTNTDFKVNTERKDAQVKNTAKLSCTKKIENTAKKSDHCIPHGWQPSDRCYELMARAGISKDFANGLIDEFVFYWEEIGEKRKGWDTTFLNHAKRQQEFANKKPPATPASNNRGSYQQPPKKPVYELPDQAFNDMPVIDGKRIA